MKQDGKPQWRLATPSDVDAITLIADALHSGLPERRDVLAQKVSLYPPGCLVLSRNGAIAGYGLCHPWVLNSIPPLDALLDALPANADCLYVHDVAILPEARGHKAAGDYLERLVALADRDGLGHLALVSVYNTHEFWGRHGFEITQAPGMTSKLASYGDTARYMVRGLER